MRLYSSILPPFRSHFMLSVPCIDPPRPRLLLYRKETIPEGVFIATSLVDALTALSALPPSAFATGEEGTAKKGAGGLETIFVIGGSAAYAEVLGVPPPIVVLHHC